MISKLYYECHVTIEPLFEQVRLDRAKVIAKVYGFSVADLLMQKRKEDTPERNKNDTFMTGRGKRYEELETRMAGLINTLQYEGFKEWRYKIEDTIVDSKFKDELGILLFTFQVIYI